MSHANLTRPDGLRLIAQVPGYWIQDGGEVWAPPNRANREWHTLKPRVSNRGRLVISFRTSDRRTLNLYVHRLVLEAFVGPCPPGMECCHCDGNPFNNFVVNLRWDTPTNNWADRREHGTVTRGEKNGLAVLTESDVMRIFQLRRDGVGTKEISRIFNVHQTTVQNVLRRATWSYVKIPDGNVPSDDHFKLTSERVP